MNEPKRDSMYTNRDTVAFFKACWVILRDKHSENKLQVALCDYHMARLNMLSGNTHIGLPLDFALQTVNLQRRRELLNP